MDIAILLMLTAGILVGVVIGMYLRDCLHTLKSIEFNTRIVVVEIEQARKSSEAELQAESHTYTINPEDWR